MCSRFKFWFSEAGKYEDCSVGSCGVADSFLGPKSPLCKSYHKNQFFKWELTVAFLM